MAVVPTVRNSVRGVLVRVKYIVMETIIYVVLPRDAVHAWRQFSGQPGSHKNVYSPNHSVLITYAPFLSYRLYERTQAWESLWPYHIEPPSLFAPFTTNTRSHGNVRAGLWETGGIRSAKPTSTRCSPRAVARAFHSPTSTCILLRG